MSTWNTPLRRRRRLTYTDESFDPYWLAQAALAQEYVEAEHSQDLKRPLCDYVEDGQVCREGLGHDRLRHPTLGIYEYESEPNVPQVGASQTVRGKVCRLCGSWLPLDRFHRGSGKYGRQPKCAECRSINRGRG